MDLCYEEQEPLFTFDENLLISLDKLEDNSEAIIVKVKTNTGPFTRLCHMGLTPGTRVLKIHSGPLRGPVEIRIRDTLLAIGYELAKNILVHFEGDHDELPRSPASA